MRPLLLIISALLFTQPLSGQDRTDPLRFAAWPVKDARHFIGSRSAKDLIYVAGASAVLLGASRFDRSLTDGLADATRDMPMKFVEEFGNAKSVRPMTGLLFVGALMSGNQRLQDASFTALESVIFANLITNALKTAIGRARPYQAEGPSSIAPFSGNTSFPSGHTTTVFALVTPFALYYPGIASKSLFLLAAATASSRMATEFHWFTDVLGGAVIGILTARTLSNLHRGRPSRVRIRPRVAPGQVTLDIRF